MSTNTFPERSDTLPEHLNTLLAQERVENSKHHLNLLSLVLFLTGAALLVQHLLLPVVAVNTPLWRWYLGVFSFICLSSTLTGLTNHFLLDRFSDRQQLLFIRLVAVLLILTTTALSLLDLRSGNDTSVYLIGIFLLAIGFRIGRKMQLILIGLSALTMLIVLSLLDYQSNIQIMLAIIIYAGIAAWIAWSLENQRTENLLLRSELKERNQELTFLSSRDPLTGAYNRRAFFEYVEILAEQSKRYGTDLSVAILDIDKFKRVNDTLGHAAGDTVLKTISDRLVKATRKCDLTARYGGEEFITVMSNTHLKSALQVSERLRKEIEFLQIPEVDWTITVSIGVAMYRPAEESFDDTLIRADRALYEGKDLGGNTVTAARLTATHKDQP